MYMGETLVDWVLVVPGLSPEEVQRPPVSAVGIYALLHGFPG